MKHVVLSALTLMLISNCQALAENRSSAGAAAPKKLGGDERNPNAAPKATETKTSTSAATATGGKAVSKIPDPVKPAFGGKGLVPPPPEMVTGLGAPPAKRRAKRKREDAPGAVSTESKLVTVATGGPYRFTGKEKEEFTTVFQWQPDDKSDKLTLKANYSPLGTSMPHFTWLRVMMGNRILATEQNLRNKTDLTLDLTNSLETGPNQIVVSGNATPGATFDWKMTTPKKVKLTSLNPADEVVVGQDLTLKGENFDSTASKDIVGLGRKTYPANIATGTTELKLRIPRDIEPGEYPVNVTVDGLTSKTLKITVRGIPELSGTNLQGCPPGAQLIVYGKNFSKKIGENKVTFGGTSAEVVACTTDQLTVIVPNFYTGLQGDTAGVAGQVGIPIRVKVGKIDSINTVPINVGNSTWADPGLQQGPGIPQVPVDWRRLLDNQ